MLTKTGIGLYLIALAVGQVLPDVGSYIPDPSLPLSPDDPLSQIRNMSFGSSREVLLAYTDDREFLATLQRITKSHTKGRPALEAYKGTSYLLLGKEPLWLGNLGKVANTRLVVTVNPEDQSKLTLKMMPKSCKDPNPMYQVKMIRDDVAGENAPLPDIGYYVHDPDYPLDTTRLMIEDISFDDGLSTARPREVSFTLVNVDGTKLRSGAYLREIQTEDRILQGYTVDDMHHSYTLESPYGEQIHLEGYGDVSLSRFLVTTSPDNLSKVTITLNKNKEGEMKFKMAKSKGKEERKKRPNIPTTVLGFDFTEDVPAGAAPAKKRRRKGEPRKVVRDVDGKPYYQQ